jgi:hypothetical protein
MPGSDMMDFLKKNGLMVILGLLAVVVVGYLIYQMLVPAEVPTQMVAIPSVHPEEAVMDEAMHVTEGFQDTQPPIVTGGESPAEQYQASSPSEMAAQPTDLNQLPSECYPKDVLNSADLLPRDANSLWAQVAPNGQGALTDQNFLTAGYHIGINTVGQTLRNANRQLRSDPPNPQVKVSPWNQTTIEPDINRRPLEIGGAL